MATVKSGGQTPQGGYQTEKQMKETHPKDRPRDDLREAFAGDENEGPTGHHKSEDRHSTKLRSRKTEASKQKTPIR